MFPADVAGSDLGVEIFKSHNITWGASSGEGGEFIVDVPQRDAIRCHEKCGAMRRRGAGKSCHGGHLEKVTSRKTAATDGDDVTEYGSGRWR